MAVLFSASARRLGIASALITVAMIFVYAITLVAGLSSAQQPIGDPLFSILEVLIILVMPPMVALMVAVHAWAPIEDKVFSLAALVFMTLVAGLTCSQHFVILATSAHHGPNTPLLKP